jgi:Pvc16 N-terminal domain
MSNALAIAAVTATLKSLISVALSGAEVTVKTPDKAALGTTESLNLFLYHVTPSNAWRNQAMQGSARPGETANPTLGLNLYYVLSACGATEEIAAHRLLGLAMSALHDHPLLTPAEIAMASSGTEGAGSDLDRQVERVRITLQPLSIEDMYKLWSAFQTSYRVSAAYEVSVVLVESTRPTRAPLPVLRIGPAQIFDESTIDGPVVQAELPSFPVIYDLAPPYDRTSALLGDTLSISGSHLSGTTVMVELSHRLWTEPVLFTPLPSPATTDTKVTFVVSASFPDWPTGLEWLPGLYTATVLLTTGSKTQRTNSIVFSLAPRITNTPLATLPPDPPDPQSLQIDFEPRVWPDQRLSVLLGGQEIRVPSVTSPTGSLTVPVGDIAPGDYYVRLRVDGIDSQLIVIGDGPPHFNTALQVTLS